MLEFSYAILAVFLIFGTPAILAFWTSARKKKFYKENPDEARKVMKRIKEDLNRNEQSISSSDKFLDEAYTGISAFFGVVTFALSYLYCIFNYGYLLGFGLGWIPSLILAALVAFLWPALVVVFLLLLLSFYVE